MALGWKVPALFVVSVIVGTLGDSASAQQLRVMCQAGFPPYSDVHPTRPTECHGLFNDMFTTIANRMNLSYTVDVLHTDDVDGRLSPNPSTAAPPEYDAAIAFHTVNPERLAIVDFSVTIYQTTYCVALQPRFHKTRTSLVESVIRDSVLYLFSWIAFVSAVSALIFFVFETIAPEPTELLENPLWQRVFWAMEQGLEATINGGTCGDLRHPISRFWRTIAGLVGLVYLVGIFGAVITAQMTTSALGAGNPTVSDLRGTRIASASPSIRPFLESPNVGVTVDEVPDIEVFAHGFYNASRPATDHGFVAPCATVAFLHNRFGGANGGFVITDEFSPTGSVDLKAFPFAKTANRTLLDDFNFHAEHMRADGELAVLISRWVQPTSTPDAEDFPVPDAAATALTVVCAVGFGLVFVVTFALLIMDSVRKTTTEAGEPVESDEDAPAVLRYRGRDHELSPMVVAMLDAAVASLERGDEPAAAAAPCCRKILGMPMDGYSKEQQQ